MKIKFLLNRGFTLVEVLVVLVIISVLITIVYASFADSRESAKNKALIAEFKETKLGLELYRAQNGSYPTNLNDLLPDYIDSLPQDEDAVNSSCSINYDTGANGSWYKLTGVWCISDVEDIGPDNEMARCPTQCSSVGCGGNSYNTNAANFKRSIAIYSFGGECE